MKPYIVLAHVSETEIDRRDLENIEDQSFKTLEDLQNELKTTNFEIYTLSEFMDLWNNEEVTPEQNWIGYINLEEEI